MILSLLAEDPPDATAPITIPLPYDRFIGSRRPRAASGARAFRPVGRLMPPHDTDGGSVALACATLYAPATSR